MGETYDVVVVGGGFCGAGMATVLARAGLSCLVLERDRVFEDHTKGEWIAPWGVGEARRVGLEDDIRLARGHVLRRHAAFGPGIDPDGAVAEAIPLALLPGIDGPVRAVQARPWRSRRPGVAPVQAPSVNVSTPFTRMWR